MSDTATMLLNHLLRRGMSLDEMKGILREMLGDLNDVIKYGEIDL